MGDHVLMRRDLFHNLGSWFTRTRVRFLEWQYSTHLRIRFLHDSTYEKVRWYKQWNDKKYSNAVHKATLVAFIISFVVFSGLQNLFPYLFNLGQPRTVMAGSTTATWTSQTDFESNASTTGETTNRDGIDTASSSGDAKLSNGGTEATNTYLFWDGGAAPTNWTIVSDVGGQFYQRMPRGAATFGGTGGSDTHTHSLPSEQMSATAVTLGASGINGSGCGGQAVMGIVTSHYTKIFETYSTKSTESSLPSYKNLKVIKYTGIPPTIPAGAIGIFDNTSLPANWTRYSGQDNYFIRGEINNIGTPLGSNNHTHTISGTSHKYTPVCYLTAYDTSTTTNVLMYGHTHTFSSVTDSVNNIPPSLDVVLAKADSDTQMPLGLIAMFDSNQLGSNWENVSDDTNDPFYNKFIRGNANYGNPTNISDHSHTFSGTTDSSAQAQMARTVGSGGISMAAPTSHSHNFSNFTVNSNSHIPSYVNVIFGKRKVIGYIGGYLSADATKVGLRVDAGVGGKAVWNSIAFNGTLGSAASNAIKFAVRTSNDGTTWSNLLGRDGNAIDWNSNYLGQVYGGTLYNTLPTLPYTRYINIVVRLEADSNLQTTLNDVTLSYNVIDPISNVNMSMWKSDGTTQIGTNGAAPFNTNQTSIKLKATGLACTGCNPASTGLKMQIENKLVGTSFNDGGAVGTDYIQDGGTGDADGSTNGFVTLNGLTLNSSYHWRARAVDDQGRVSAWTSYGANAENVADFAIDQVVPGISNFAIYGNTTGDSNYVNASLDLNMIKATVDLSDNVDSNLWVQFSEDVNENGVADDAWGVYDETAGSNNITGGATWSAGTYITVSGITSSLTNKAINTAGNNGAWKISSEGNKTIYVRVRDTAGNMAGAFTNANGGYWTYKKQVNINGATNAGTNYQVKLLVGESSGTGGTNVNVDGHSNATSGIFDDVRFTSAAGSELGYWRESVTGSAPNRIGTFWVKVTDDLTTAKSIYISYGNANATNASNGSNTYIHYADYTGGSANGWTGLTSIPNYGNHTRSSCGGNNSGVAYSPDIAIPASGAKVEMNIAQGATACGDGAGSNTHSEIFRVNKQGVYTNLDTGNFGWMSKTYDLSSFANQTIKLESYASGTGNAVEYCMYDDGCGNCYQYGYYNYGYNSYSYLDDIKVRKYVNPEPAFSSAGSEGTALVNDNIILDITSPDIGVITAKTASGGSAITAAVEPNGPWQSDNDPYFSWSAPSDTSDIAGYYYAMDNPTPENGGTWLNLPNPPNATPSYQYGDDTVSDGKHTFYVRAKDGAGNQSGVLGSFVIWVDSLPPSVTDGQTGDDNWRGSNTATYNVDFSDSGSGLQKYEIQARTATGGGGSIIQVGGNDWTAVAINGAPASYTEPWSLPTAVWNALPENTSYIYVRAYDMGNAVSGTSEVFYVKKDTSGPSAPATVNDGTSTDISYTGSTTQLSANWSTSNDTYSGLQKYQYAIGTTQGGTDVVGWTDNDPPAQAYVTKTGLTLSNGSTYWFSIRAVDIVGNTGSAANSNGAMVDALAPTGSVTVNSGNPDRTNNKAVTIIMTPTTPEPGGSGMSQFQLSNDGATWGTTTDADGTVTNSGTWGTWNESYRTTGFTPWNLVKGAADGGTDGSRTVYVKYKDNATNTSSDITDTITLDTTAPTFNSVTPASSANRNNADVTFTLSEELQAGAYIRFTGTSGSDSGNTHDYNLTESDRANLSEQSHAVSGLVNGNTYTLSLYGQDLAGTTDNTADNTGIKYDTAEPTFTIAYYTNTDLAPEHALTNNFMKAGTYFIKITSTDYTGLSGTPTVNIGAEGTANDVPPGSTATTLVSGSDYKFTRAVVFDANAIGSVAEDITITATDNAGNTATNATVDGEKYTDTVAPTLPTVTIDSNNELNSAKAKVGDTVTVHVTSSENINTPTITMATPLRDATESGAGTSWTGSIVMSPTTDAEGNVAFNIAFSDIAGNNGTAVTSTNDASIVSFDKTPPGQPVLPDFASVDDNGSSDTDNITSNTTGLTFAGGDSSLEALSTVTIFDGATNKGTTSANGSGAWTKDIDLAEGIHTITVTSTDAAGNISDPSAELTVTVDTTDPTSISLTAPEDLTWVGTVRPTLSWTQTTETNFWKYEVFVDGVSKANVTNIATTSWQFDYDLTEGTHTWYVEANDLAGHNYSSVGSLFTVKIDVTAPGAPTEVTASPVSWTSDNIWDFSWTSPGAGTGSPIAGYYWKALSAPTSNTDGTWVAEPTTSTTQTVPGLAQGANTFYVFAKDSANPANVNYQNTGTTTFYFDNVKPVSDVLIGDTHYGPNTFSTTTINGTASDVSSGLAKTEITIQRNSNNQYYNPTLTGGTGGWQDNAYWINVGSGGTWTYDLPEAKMDNSVTYTVTSKSTDNSSPAMVQTDLGSDSFTWDMQAPSSTVGAFSRTYYSSANKPSAATGTNSDTGGSNTSWVKLRIRDANAAGGSNYWTGGGGWGAQTDLSVTNTGTNYSTWTYDISGVTWTTGHTYHFGVYSQDGVTNEETFAEDRSFTYDDSAPTRGISFTTGWYTGTGISIDKTFADGESGTIAWELQEDTGSLTDGNVSWNNNYVTVDSSNAASYNKTGASGTAYRYRFRVKNGADTYSTYDSNSNGEIKIDTSAPTVDSFSYADGWNTSGSFTVTKSQSDAQSGLLAYELQEATAVITNGTVDPFGGWGTIDANSGNYNKSGASSGVAYKYRYRIQNNAGTWSDYSTSTNIVKVDTIAPSAVAELAALGTDSTTIKVTWKAPIEAHAGVASYVVQRTAKLDPYNAGTDPTTYSYNALGTNPDYVKTINPANLPADVEYDSGTGVYTFIDTASGMTDQSWHGYRIKTLDAAGNDSNYIYGGQPDSDDNYKAGKTNTPPAISNLTVAPDTDVSPGTTISIGFDAIDEEISGHNDLDAFFNPTGGYTKVKVINGAGTTVMDWTEGARTPIAGGYHVTSSYDLPVSALYGTYTVFARAIDSVGVVGRQTGVSEVTFAVPPGATSALVATGASNSSVTLSFGPPGGRTNDSLATTGVKDYTVQRKVSTAGDETYANIVTITSGDVTYYSGNTYTYTDENLALETYRYRIRANDNTQPTALSGSWTISNDITVPDTAAPTSVSNLSVSPGADGTSVDLSWSIPADNSDSSNYEGKGVYQFKIYRRAADSNFVSGDLIKTLTKGTDPEFESWYNVGEGISFVSTGLSPTTTYHYLVTAVDKGLPEGDGFGANESTLTATQGGNYQDVTTLAVPQGMMIRSASDQLTDGNARIVVSWTPLTVSYASAPAPYQFANFIIERKVNSGAWSEMWTISDIATNFKVDDHLNPDDTYWYRVKVKNSNNDVSNLSSEVSMQPNAVDTEKPTITFDKTSGTDLSATASTITIHFTTSEQATPIVEYDTAANFTTNGTLGQSRGTGTLSTDHTVVLTGLTPETAYRFRLKASDAAGNTGESQDTGNVPYSKSTGTDATPPTNPDVPKGYSEQNPATRVEISSGNWYNYASPYFEWNAASDTDSEVAGYYVYLGTSPSGDPALTSGILTANDGARRFESTTAVATGGLTSGNTYYLRVKTKDGAANVTGQAATLFEYKYDSSAPISAVVLPAASTINSVSISGTAFDEHSNLNRVLIRLKKSVSGTTTYWSTSSKTWTSEAETWNLATGLGEWTLSSDLPSWDNNQVYTVESKAIDNAGTEQSVLGSSTFTYDAAAPQIQDLTKTEGITSTVFEWNTSNKTADSAVEFWKDGAGHETISDSRMVNAHKITIEDLDAATTYNYKVISKDVLGNTGEVTGTFTTKSTSDVVVTNQIESATVTIEWATVGNQSSSYVEYSLSTSDFTNPNRTGVKVVGQDEHVESHSVIVYDLEPLQLYNFRIKSLDAKGNTMVASNQSGTFGTFFIDKVAPLISNVNVSAAVSSAVLSWSTNEGADSIVEYRKADSEEEYRSGTSDPLISGHTSHSITLKKLESDKLYKYRIKSKDASGNLRVTDEGEFSTLTLGMGSPTVKTTSSSATITWPTVFNSSSYVEFQKQNSNQPSKIEGTGNMTQSHSVSLNNLSSGLYSYKVKSMDADNNIAETPLGFFEIPTADTVTLTTPEAGKIQEQEITASSAKITWKSTVATTSWVDYGTSSGSYSKSAGSDNMSTDHVVTLEGLTPDTTYYYVVRGKDANGIEYKSREYSFTAVARPEISDIKVTDIKPYSAVVNFRTSTATEATVSYGETTAYGNKAGSPELTKDHRVELKDLTDGVTYHYAVEVKDKAGNATKSADATFATPVDTEGPKIGEVKIDLLPLGSDDETAQSIISWTTDKPSTTKVEYDEGVIGGKYSKSSIEDDSLNKSHTVIVKGLNPATTYHFRLVTKDKRGNRTDSQDYTFVTPAKEKSIWQLIVKSIEETFSWVKNVGKFFQNLGKKNK